MACKYMLLIVPQTHCERQHEVRGRMRSSLLLRMQRAMRLSTGSDQGLPRSCIASQSQSRSYPSEPRVGVGVVILRQPKQTEAGMEVLLVQRGKEPNKGGIQ
jgi:hypothetical protein